MFILFYLVVHLIWRSITIPRFAQQTQPAEIPGSNYPLPHR